MKIPEHCKALWKQLTSEEDAVVDVHEQELTKASDVKWLFENGLIRVVHSDKLLPSVAIVLSEAGKAVKSES